MDAEKRHQLKQNELAAVLGKIRDFTNDRPTRYWLVVLLVVAVAVVGYRWWGHLQNRQLASGWSELTEAAPALQGDLEGAVERLHEVIADTSDNTLAASARIRLATALRRQSQAQSQADQREELLNESAATLRVVIDDPQTPAALVATAAFSLGTTYESLGEFDQARLDDAAELYRMITTDARFAGNPFTLLAEARLDTIDDLRVTINFVPGMPPQPQPMSQPTTAQPRTAQPLATEEPLVGPPATPTIVDAPPAPAESDDQSPTTQPAPDTPGAEAP